MPSASRGRRLHTVLVQASQPYVFADEIDAIAGKRESAQREMERRIVAQMLTCMDDLAAPRPAKIAKSGEETFPGAVSADRHVLVIGQSSAVTAREYLKDVDFTSIWANLQPKVLFVECFFWGLLIAGDLHTRPAIELCIV
jgi:hypothetical protein